MEKGNQVLLYRIDVEKKQVIFICSENNKKAWKNIPDSAYYYMSFNEIFEDTLEFHKTLNSSEPIISKLVKGLDCGQKNTRILLDELDFDNSSHFFTQYYFSVFNEVFPQEVSRVYHDFRIFSKAPLLEAQDRVNEMLEQIRNITDLDFFQKQKTKGKTEAFRIIYDKIVIRSNDYNEMFTIADTPLVNFFFEFSYTLSKAGIHVCSCKNCKNLFLGNINSQYCSSSECQKEYRRIQKNNREVERKKQPYNKPISSVDNYIGKAKSDLLKKTNDNDIIKSKFEETESTVKKEIRDFVEEYKVDKRDPEDDEMKQKVSELKKQIGTLKTNLIIEYEQKHQTIET